MLSVAHRLFRGLIILLAVAAGCLLYSCSAGIGRTCEVDSDCAAAQICANGQCTRTCTKDEDCLRPSFACRPLDDASREATINVCVTTDAGSNEEIEPSCTSDQQCRQQLDREDAKCGIDGRCIIAQTRRGLLIRDRTNLSAEPGPESRRGAEIGAAYLADDQGQPVAYGQTLDYSPGAGLEGVSHIDGREQMLTEQRQCVLPPLDERTTPLGGGEMLLEFVDNNRQTVSIARNQKAVVVEWAQANCGDSEDDQDSFEVYLCESGSGRLEPDDCDDLLVDSASGWIEMTLRPSDSGTGEPLDTGTNTDTF